MDWFSYCLEGSLLTAMGILQLGFVAGFTGKKAKIWHFALYLFLVYADTAAAYIFGFNRAAILIQLFALWSIGRFALKNSPSTAAVTSILALHITQLSFGIMNPLEFLLFQDMVGKKRLYVFIVIVSLLALLVCVVCYRFIVKKFALTDGREEYIWLLLPPEIFLIAVEFYMLDTAYGKVLTAHYSLDINKEIELLALQILSLAALFSTLYAYRHARSSFQSQAALASLTQESKAQRTYVTQAQMRYEQTQAFRHDMKNHLSVLDGLLKKENYEQAQLYLEKLDTVTKGLSFPVHTGNPVIDILLGDKLEFAKTAGIGLELSFTLPQTASAINDFDLCIIFANAIDNAIQACAQVEGEKTIRIMGQRQGDFYILEFENTCLSGPQEKMGTGLMNIKHVTEKYGGTMTIEKYSQVFCLNVLLNISLQPEDR